MSDLHPTYTRGRYRIVNTSRIPETYDVYSVDLNYLGRPPLCTVRMQHGWFSANVTGSSTKLFKIRYGGPDCQQLWPPEDRNTYLALLVAALDALHATGSFHAAARR